MEQVTKIINGREYTITLMNALDAYKSVIKIMIFGDDLKFALKAYLSSSDETQLIKLFELVTFKNNENNYVAITKENFNKVFEKRCADILLLAEAVAEENFSSFFLISQVSQVNNSLR